MLNWLSRNGKAETALRDNAELTRLEHKIEQLEKTMVQLTKETRKQNIVVRQLQIHQPVVENVTFRLDALDIKDLSGSLNLGNNFDVQFDPSQLFSGRKSDKPKQDERNDTLRRDSTAARYASEPSDAGGSTIRSTPRGYSYRCSDPSY